MTFGMNRGELALVVFIFVAVYVAGLLPKLVRLVAGDGSREKGE